LNTLHIGRQTYQPKFLILLAGMTIALASCSSKQVKPSNDMPVQTAVGVGANGPEPLPSPSSTTEAYGPPQPTPSPITTDSAPKQLMVVLSPDLNASLAYVGALRELKEQKIPFKIVVGVESSSLMASLFLASETNGQLDWKLAQIQKELFDDKQNVVEKFIKKNKKESFKEKVESLLSIKKINEGPYSSGLLVKNQTTGELYWLRSGKLSEGVLQATAKSSWLGGDERPTGLSKEMVEKTKLEFPNTAWIVLTTQPVALPDSEIPGIIVPMAVSPSDAVDFQKKSKIIFLGKKIIRSHLPQIKALAATVGGEHAETH